MANEIMADFMRTRDEESPGGLAIFLSVGSVVCRRYERDHSGRRSEREAISLRTIDLGG